MRDIGQAPRISQRRGAAEIARLGDVLIACILLAITLPLMMIVALAIKLENPGPFWTSTLALDVADAGSRC